MSKRALAEHANGVRCPDRFPRLSKLHASWRNARSAFLALALIAGSARAADKVAEPGPTPWLGAFTRPPLDSPLVITGGFGEYRIGHFHAGFDFGTGGRVGAPVYAPLPGSIERIRASGVGYGRSVYLRTDDGRLLQFGHLDGYTDALAAYVAAVQESSGQYEQDLWPEAGRFRFRAGDRIAWTGQSGAGGPHMHFEIRRGDMAYHPLRAGLVANDTTKPTLAGLTLEPLDGASRVEGGVRPRTFSLTSAGADTIRAIGRLRAIVAARDGVWRGVDRMVPWSTRMEWNGEWVDARLDSISWATDMIESDYVYDAGRVIGDKGIVLWAPAGWRPRVIVTNVPRDREAGTITIAPGDPPRPLKLVARDAAGNRSERTLVVVPSRAVPPPPKLRDPTDVSSPSASKFEFDALPGGRLRIVFRGAPTGSRNVRMSSHGETVSAVFDRGVWSAILTYTGGLQVIGETDSSVWQRSGPRFHVAPKSWGNAVDRQRVLTMTEMLETDGLVFQLPSDGTFDDELVLVRDIDSLPPLDAELRPVTKLAWIGPEAVPLRKPLQLAIGRKMVTDTSGVGLYAYRGGEWEWVRWSARSDRRGWDASPSRLGTFALLRDSRAPRITVAAAPARPKTAPAYSRWAIEARLVDGGSGVDARASYFVVDGKRVPSEWDSEEGVLRWRPRRVPKSGTHHYVVVATDRAGNAGRLPGSFVLH